MLTLLKLFIFFSLQVDFPPDIRIGLLIKLADVE